VKTNHVKMVEFAKLIKMALPVIAQKLTILDLFVKYLKQQRRQNQLQQILQVKLIERQSDKIIFNIISIFNLNHCWLHLP